MNSDLSVIKLFLEASFFVQVIMVFLMMVFIGVIDRVLSLGFEALVKMIG